MGFSLCTNEVFHLVQFLSNSGMGNSISCFNSFDDRVTWRWVSSHCCSSSPGLARWAYFYRNFCTVLSSAHLQNSKLYIDTLVEHLCCPKWVACLSAWTNALPKERSSLLESVRNGVYKSPILVLWSTLEYGHYLFLIRNKTTWRFRTLWLKCLADAKIVKFSICCSISHSIRICVCIYRLMK